MSCTSGTATIAASPSRTQPNLAEVYRARVGRLREGLAASEGREVLAAARALIARVEVHPPGSEGGRGRLELVGELSAMLGLVGAKGVAG
ncbi:MAG: hypothetical protein MUF65_06805, partial [Rubritepida sp.]|nr:hypothetical protein [Rubritepida sp.]